jgi:hypothetical protein
MAPLASGSQRSQSAVSPQTGSRRGSQVYLVHGPTEASFMKSKLSIDRDKLSIDQVVKLVRELNPPKPKTEIFIPDPMQPGFGIRLLPSGVASWIML